MRLRCSPAVRRIFPVGGLRAALRGAALRFTYRRRKRSRNALKRLGTAKSLEGQRMRILAAVTVSLDGLVAVIRGVPSEDHVPVCSLCRRVSNGAVLRRGEAQVCPRGRIPSTRDIIATPTMQAAALPLSASLLRGCSSAAAQRQQAKQQIRASCSVLQRVSPVTRGVVSCTHSTAQALSRRRVLCAASQSEEFKGFGAQASPAAKLNVNAISEALKGCNIYLVGMMGSGKSTVGEELSKKLGYYYFDTDQLIEDVAGRSIPAIFAEDGEESFRDLEQQIMEQMCAFTRAVVSTGGGMVLRRANWGHMRHGVTVWLNPSVELLAERLSSKERAGRPLLADAETEDDTLAKVQSMFTDREGFYKEADAEVQVLKSDDPERVADKVLVEVEKLLRDMVAQQKVAEASNAVNDTFGA